MRKLGSAISYLPGLSVFDGQHGWVLTTTLLLAVAMITASGLLGWRRLARPVARPAAKEEPISVG